MVSCESDSIENTNSVISGYKKTLMIDYADPALPDYDSIVIGNLLNGKLFSETYETFLNVVSQGAPTTVQRYFYSNNHLEQLSCGKQVMQFPRASYFSLGFMIASHAIYSKNVTSDEFAGSTYLIMPDGFYNKKTTTNTSSFENHSEELKFFFN